MRVGLFHLAISFDGGMAIMTECQIIDEGIY